MQNNLRLNGTQDFMGIEIPVIEGGFGEGRIVSAHTVAKIHDVEVKEINRLINDNIDEFEEGIDLLNLLKVGATHLEIKKIFNINLPPVAKNFYILSEQGYIALASLMRTSKAKEIRKEFRRHYFRLRQQVKTIMSETDKAILNIVNAEDSIQQALAIKEFKNIVEKPLIEEIDRYSRFLCDKLSTLTKSELATKLDTKPQTLASLFKKLGIYTPKNSQVQIGFLKKFKEVKMIIQTENTFTNPKTGIEITKSDWQWTGEGAKLLVDYLIELGYVTFTENKGFKLTKTK